MLVCLTPLAILLTVYSAIVKIKSFAKAIKDPKWIDVIKSEIIALEKNNTWSIVDIPSGNMSTGSRMDI